MQRGVSQARLEVPERLHHTANAAENALLTWSFNPMEACLQQMGSVYTLIYVSQDDYQAQRHGSHPFGVFGP